MITTIERYDIDYTNSMTTWLKLNSAAITSNRKPRHTQRIIERVVIVLQVLRQRNELPNGETVNLFHGPPYNAKILRKKTIGFLRVFTGY